MSLVSFLILGDSNAYFDDFSPRLVNYAVKRFGNDANHRMQILLNSVQQMKVSSGFDNGKTPPQVNISSKEFISLGKVNDFYNQVPYFSDITHWNVEDFWATPIEFVASLGGDCEDYAIAKYMTLKSIGVPLERMRITYVRAIKLNEAHMVLAYYPTVDAEPWILDNLVPEIKPASARTDLVPVYSFNDDDIWLANGLNNKGGASNVRLWKDLREKMVKEKLL
jgi:predicted transglutaminase-like cysteine proteinase